MATITARPRHDGSVGFTAQIRIKRGGKVVYTTSQTFDNEKDAKTWAARKEKELALPGALDAALHPSGTLEQAINRYVEASRKEIGKTKAQVLEAIKRDSIAGMDCEDIRSRDIVAFAERLGVGRQPQTVLNYLSHLSAVFRIAHGAWGMRLDPAEMDRAMVALKSLGAVQKSARRDRRPTIDEMNDLVAHFVDRSRRRNALPMHLVTVFAMFSTRRQEEIIRIRWDDLQPGRVLVRDMKNPGEKMGNHVWCDLPPEAERIIAQMPRRAPEIFPFTTDAVSASFTRACKVLGIEDLRFHDLRHEGVSRLFEMGWTIPQVACVSGHRSWQSLQRYSHMRAIGDRWVGWAGLDQIAPAKEVDDGPNTAPATDA